MNAAERIQATYAAQTVVGETGTVHKLRACIDPREGEFITALFRNDPSLVTTLEVGCAYGLSSLQIMGATQRRPQAFHTIIDPFQRTIWDGAGLRNLREAGLSAWTWVEKKSEFALPALLEERGEGRFDFIFVDGWRTFDHTLLDCFYATRLLRVGGILAINDLAMPSVRRVVAYLRQYPCYQGHGQVTTPRSWPERLRENFWQDRRVSMVALRKVEADQRPWDWDTARAR